MNRLKTFAFTVLGLIVSLAALGIFASVGLAVLGALVSLALIGAVVAWLVSVTEPKLKSTEA